jgi:SAM-dependent methyltransferase
MRADWPVCGGCDMNACHSGRVLPLLRRKEGAMAENLTLLADRFGSDKGSAKHRYTELYHMLFHPLRDRKLTFLEMGLLIGGPELGISADRATQDLPSIRMWLDYFPKAAIHGLDVSDFSWFTHDRFTFHRCDMDARANIAAAAAAMPDFDVIIDDASHASHHQQFALLELFPRLRPGGLYIIEDLRWQPAAYERPGFTKTATLLRGYSENRVFRHRDAAMQLAFQALAPGISGCFLFQVQYARTRRDQVAVIHKR